MDPTEHEQSVESEDEGSDVDTLEGGTSDSGSDWSGDSESEEAERLAEIAEEGNYELFIEQARDLSDEALAWALTACASPAIASYIVRDRCEWTYLPETWFKAAKENNVEMMEFIEGLDREQPVRHLLDHSATDLREALSDTHELIEFLAEPLLRMSKAKLGTAHRPEDRAVIDAFLAASDAMRKLVEERCTEGLARLRAAENA
jgi:hypothetical protein